MRKITTLLLSLTLLLTGTAPAQADWGHRRDFRPHHYYQPAPAHRHHRHHHNNWIGPAAVIGLTGLAIGSLLYNQPRVEVAPVYTPAPAAPAYSGGTWYYCHSSGQYYPYTNACPEGWQAVPAR